MGVPAEVVEVAAVAAARGGRCESKAGKRWRGPFGGHYPPIILYKLTRSVFC
jgi:hypothetical protein